ncbi:hypothetical protein TWF718_002986 [Orbilia javanica]|uniref:Hydrophobin n=1 Tax=Orbilia javanica TaxID=47235 RepID=A0AAN8MP81_9PEZI
MQFSVIIISVLASVTFINAAPVPVRCTLGQGSDLVSCDALVDLVGVEAVEIAVPFATISTIRL